MLHDCRPHLTATVPAIPGRIRHDPGDFRVEEVPAYTPSGHGEHLFVQFEKTDLTTPEAVRRLARALSVPPQAASFAGMKDRRAITTQWASFAGASPEAATHAAVEGVRVLASAPHHRKLRTGHLRANRFQILVRDVPGSRWPDIPHMLDTLLRTGVPNYYEAQRFGRDGGNLDRARRWLVEGGRPPRDRSRRKWDVSVLQSWLFNEVLAARIRAGDLARALPGDLMRREETGGLFVSDGPGADQERVDQWEISPTGPMFGPRMRWPEAEARDREQAALDDAGLSTAHLERFGRAGQGTRRALRVRPGDARAERVSEGVRLTFELPTGAYATGLLRELFKEGLRVETGNETVPGVVNGEGPGTTPPA
jgi:tRNA pseudouridine13 synthase